MAPDIMEAAASVLSETDRFFLPDIFYAGGTADTSISSADVAADLNRLKPIGIYLTTKAEVAHAIAQMAQPGDIVVSMGARDPGLGAFAQGLAQEIKARYPNSD